jgi:hypothetical protein
LLEFNEERLIIWRILRIPFFINESLNVDCDDEFDNKESRNESDLQGLSG